MTRTLPVLALLLAGCISGKSPPARTFVLEVAPPSSRAQDAPAAGRALRWRGVVASKLVDERQIWRVSPEEVWIHELQRWSEPPADTVGRALARHLFEGEGLRRTGGLDAPSLEVELRTLEEVRDPGKVRIEIGVLLVGSDGVARLERTFLREVNFKGEEPEDVVRAHGALVSGLLPEIAREVAKALSEG